MQDASYGGFNGNKFEIGCTQVAKHRINGMNIVDVREEKKVCRNHELNGKDTLQEKEVKKKT